MTREEWGRRILAAALRQLRARLSGRLRFTRCRIQRQGELWSVILECANPPGGVGRVERAAAAGAGQAPLTGRGAAHVKTQWLPGDPRLSRELKLAVAYAVGELADASDLGLRVCNWRRAAPTGSSLKEG